MRYIYAANVILPAVSRLNLGRTRSCDRANLEIPPNASEVSVIEFSPNLDVVVERAAESLENDRGKEIRPSLKAKIVKFADIEASDAEVELLRSRLGDAFAPPKKKAKKK